MSLPNYYFSGHWAPSSLSFFVPPLPRFRPESQQFYAALGPSAYSMMYSPPLRSPVKLLHPNYIYPVTAPDPSELPTPNFSTGNSDNSTKIDIEIASPKPTYAYNPVGDIEAALKRFYTHPKPVAIVSPPASNLSFKAHTDEYNKQLEGVRVHAESVERAPRPAAKGIVSPPASDLPIPHFRVDDADEKYNQLKSVQVHDEFVERAPRPEAIGIVSPHASELPIPHFRVDDTDEDNVKDQLEGVRGHVGIVAHGPRLRVARHEVSKHTVSGVAARAGSLALSVVRERMIRCGAQLEVASAVDEADKIGKAEAETDINVPEKQEEKEEEEEEEERDFYRKSVWELLQEMADDITDAIMTV
ncbi:hypothetical protein BC835DRAFT_1311409 [Cytidiella melzeri]|nr:hypothetical protein BC835DRAFT_1311409 [Cytidiella melzeri]